MATGDDAVAQARKKSDAAPAKTQTKVDGPLTILVSLKSQRLHVYDRNGLVTSSPISSGTASNPTPTGIFSIIQKNRTHFSNLYDSAPMPNMQRITWSGVALHAGVLPGYPASHGCIRLPHAFSRALFDMTTLGARVIVTHDEIAPQSFDHPRLWTALPQGLPLVASGAPDRSASSSLTSMLGVSPANAAEAAVKVAATADIAPQPGAVAETGRTIAMAREERQAEIDRRAGVVAGLEAAQREATERLAATNASLAGARVELREAETARSSTLARRAAARKNREDGARALAGFMRRQSEAMQRIAKRRQARLSEHLADAASNRTTEVLLKRAAARTAEEARETATIEKAEVEETRLEAELGDLEARESVLEAELAERSAVVSEKAGAVSAIEASLPALRIALREADQALAAARADHKRAVAALAQFDKPATVLISRRTSQIYIRQGHAEVYRGPATFVAPTSPVGTHVLSALRYRDDSKTAFDWRLLTVADPGSYVIAGRGRRGRTAAAEQLPQSQALPTTAASALDRIDLGEEARTRLAEVLKPGSTLIISDEGMSHETGEHTDIIVQPR
ncbi:MAG: L,D-transpeptidase family protein [Hyphomicrobiaceae bacterium]